MRGEYNDPCGIIKIKRIEVKNEEYGRGEKSTKEYRAPSTLMGLPSTAEHPDECLCGNTERP